jgi:DNA repair exonuclease SbcCD ATPase subunit
MSCKSLHKRQKVSKNHEFQSAKNVTPEVKLRCNEHKEDFVFVCDNCDISICMQCVTGKHYGHKVSNMKESISNLRTTFRQEMRTKLDVIQTSQKQVNTGLTTFDLDVTSVINEIKEEGTKIKAMVDRHVEKMIATLREKAQHEKEPLTKTLVDYKQQLEKAKEIEKREHKTQQSRDDASTMQHLKTLNGELSKLSVVPLPHAPSIKYSHKKVTGSDIDQLIGTYSLRYVYVIEIITRNVYYKY